jgi:hypothetical protein
MRLFLVEGVQVLSECEKREKDGKLGGKVVEV